MRIRQSPPLRSSCLVMALIIFGAIVLSACSIEPDGDTSENTEAVETMITTIIPETIPKTVATVPETVFFIPPTLPLPSTYELSQRATPETAEPGSPNRTVPVNAPPPEVLESRVPVGTPDFVLNAQRLIDFTVMGVYIGVIDLLNPEGYRHIDDSETVHPASIIKSFVMEYALLQISQGVGCLDDVISGRTLREHIERMIQLTCNTATSHVIRYFGRGNIDTWLAEHHSSTRLNYDFANFYHGGRRNSSSVLECIAHLERVFHNRAEEPYAHMYEILLNSQVRDRLPMATNHLPYVSVATKTGSFIDRGEAVDHDMGIVTATDDNGNIVVAYAIVILTYSAAIDGSVFPARPTLIAVARDIYEQFEEFAHSNT